MGLISRQPDLLSFLQKEGLSSSSLLKVFPPQQGAAKRLLEPMSPGSKAIRSWGCHLTESPLVFVHIGKSGGGTVRARFAAAALNFTREKWWNYNGDDHYYPMPTRKRFNANREQTRSGEEEAQISRGTFCSSVNNNRRRLEMKRYKNDAFERILECNAITPLGRFVGCPAVSMRRGQECKGCSNLSDSGCYAVSVGHNPVGNELHWLPAPFLQDWWYGKWASFFPPETVPAVRSITPESENPHWCPRYNLSRSAETQIAMRRRERHQQYYECSEDLSDQLDRAFLPSWESIANKFGMEKNYAPFYASMPLHRTILLREPFSWLLSRFFWNKEYRGKYKCDDVATATKFDPDETSFATSGWAYQVVLEHLLHLCGEDCMNRFEMHQIQLEDIERQAATNLRHSFSVVGLLNETNSFYEMVSARIQYSNMSNNPHIYGPLHATRKDEEQGRCALHFNENETLRASFRNALPHLEALERLYKIGGEVNRFQKREIQQCVNTMI